MAKQFRARRGVARLRPLLALTALAAATLMLCAVAENAGAPARATDCDHYYTALQAGGDVERAAVRERPARYIWGLQDRTPGR
jgi:hypothetical protein